MSEYGEFQWIADLLFDLAHGAPPLGEDPVWLTLFAAED